MCGHYTTNQDLSLSPCSHCMPWQQSHFLCYMSVSVFKWAQILHVSSNRFTLYTINSWYTSSGDCSCSLVFILHVDEIPQTSLASIFASCFRDHSQHIDVSFHIHSIYQRVQDEKTGRLQPLHGMSREGWHDLLYCVRSWQLFESTFTVLG